jgi:hypothetical protein
MTTKCPSGHESSTPFCGECGVWMPASPEEERGAVRLHQARFPHDSWDDVSYASRGAWRDVYREHLKMAAEEREKAVTVAAQPAPQPEPPVTVGHHEHCDSIIPGPDLGPSTKPCNCKGREQSEPPRKPENCGGTWVEAPQPEPPKMPTELASVRARANRLHEQLKAQLAAHVCEPLSEEQIAEALKTWHVSDRVHRDLVKAGAQSQREKCQKGRP